MKSIILLAAWLVNIAALLCLPLLAQAHQHRSHAAKLAFQREHPCPATGQHRGKCPGYVIDHIRPLCAGGPDKASNMQWQTVADAKAKDRLERRECGRSLELIESDAN